MSNFLKHSEDMERKIQLNSLNPYITCNICKGYLIEATAITECLHIFCKSCIIKHLEANTTCPTCNIVIHHSYPRQYINFDRTMQDIVYKLVPDLEKAEILREKEFYQSRGLPYPKEVPVNDEDDVKERTNEFDGSVAEQVKDELISVCLECIGGGDLRRKLFIRVATKTTIWHLMRFLAAKVVIGVEAKNIDVFCNCDLLDKRDSLKFVYLTRWKFDEVPLVLQYKANF